MEESPVRSRSGKPLFRLRYSGEDSTPVHLPIREKGCASLNKAVSGQHSKINNLEVNWFRTAEALFPLLHTQGPSEPNQCARGWATQSACGRVYVLKADAPLADTIQWS